MAIEHARAAPVAKPWGVADLAPWSRKGPGGDALEDGALIGEFCYERSSCSAREPVLLLKLLLTSQPLSLQVHPDDAFADSIGLPGGKTEAWYVLSARPGAQIALGLTRRLTPEEFRQALDDGSIVELVHWRDVFAGDIFHVPPGTIHAIGAGIVLAEIQQRNDITFRLYDHGRSRELHVERAIAVANAGPANFRVSPRSLTDERTLLAANAHFVFEKLTLAPHSAWRLETQRETWVLVIAGDGVVGSIDVSMGDALFLQLDSAYIHTGDEGLSLLAAYTTGGPLPGLLQRVGRDRAPAVSAGQTAERTQ
jgi:mannose-6-phosphate isomerase